MRQPLKKYYGLEKKAEGLFTQPQLSFFNKSQYYDQHPKNEHPAKNYRLF